MRRAKGDAARTLQDILDKTKSASGLSDADIATAMRIATTRGATRAQLDAAIPGGFDKVWGALQAGSAAVDVRDAMQERAVLDSVNDALNTAGVGSEVDPHLVTDIAEWRNMTGDLKRTGEYMRDNQVSTGQQYDDGYLSRQPHFQKRPGNFPKFSERVDDATRDALADTLPELQSPVPNLLNSQPYRDEVYDSVGAALNGGGRGTVSDAPPPARAGGPAVE